MDEERLEPEVTDIEMIAGTVKQITTAFDRLAIIQPLIKHDINYRIVDGALNTLGHQVIRLSRQKTDPLPVMEQVAEHLSAMRHYFLDAWRSTDEVCLKTLCGTINRIKYERGDTEAARHIESLKAEGRNHV